MRRIVRRFFSSPACGRDSHRKRGYSAHPVIIILISVLCLLSLSLLVTAEQTSSQLARSVILMIGDGMGAEHVKAARWSSVGPAGLLVMDQLEMQDGWIRTDNSSDVTTDSAAAATALASGVKTRKERLGVDASGQPLATILELAKSAGKSVGLVTTVQLSHATPAAFAVHNEDRDERLEIALQLMDAGVDVLLGGGGRDFLPYREDGGCGWFGQRLDGRNLFEEALIEGYDFICEAEDLLAVELGEGDRILGIFGNSGMSPPYSPSLSDMTTLAVELLSKAPDGFFLMVEAGQIDWAAHDNEAEEVIELTLGFDAAVAVALNYVQSAGDVLLIVTSDHETGGMTVVREPTGGLWEDGPLDMPNGETFYANWTGPFHTGVDVPVRAEGPYAYRLSGTTENTTIFEVMVEAMGLGNSGE
ncbi:alkaline phosphatase [Candidatus Bipolaricaulota bacterium]